MTWIQNGKPLHAPIADERKKKRKEFKRALKHCQSSAEQTMLDNIVKSLNTKQFAQFWKKSNNLIKQKTQIANQIDGFTNTEEITKKDLCRYFQE